MRVDPRIQDIIDSDFDEPEERQKEEGDDAEKEVRQSERKRRRSGKYVDPATKKRRLNTGSAVQRKPKSNEEKSKDDKGKNAKTLRTGRPSLRKSTKIASERAAEERKRRKQDDAERRRKKLLREAGKPEEKVWTQKELLEEAKETEIKNRESLKELLRLEEEKKRLPPPKKKVNVEIISVRSRDGKHTISFTDKNADARKELLPHLYKK